MVVDELAVSDPIGRICVLRTTYEEFKGSIDDRLIRWLSRVSEGLTDRDLRYLLDKVPEYHLHSLAEQLQIEIASPEFRELIQLKQFPIQEPSETGFYEYIETEEPIEFIGIDDETKAQILQQMEAA